MDSKNVSRRRFVGGLAAALGYVTTGPDFDLLAQGRGQGRGAGMGGGNRGGQSEAQYDALAKLANNENNYGIPDSVMQAMTDHWKYAGRYGYPDPGINQAIAEYDGVKPENILLTAGSGEVLNVVGSTFLMLTPQKKVLGVEPSYSSVYQHATSIKSEAIKLPLTKDFRQDIGVILDTAKKRASEIGFVYICNPNNPTGVIVTKDEIKQLLDGLPAGMPVLIDEAYHHYVNDPNYATAMPYVNEGRPVIVARTFSKIGAMAAMRVGYAVAPTELIQKMRPFSTGSVNVLARYGATATLKNKAIMEDVKRKTIESRDKTIAALKALGYDSIPSQANFFMVGLRREVQPVIQAFREEGVLVGRPFPPMTQHLRVSVGVPEEMDRFLTAFKKIMAQPVTTAARQQ
jgi:histidinol-phosphate aminotransferase